MFWNVTSRPPESVETSNTAKIRVMTLRNEINRDAFISFSAVSRGWKTPNINIAMIAEARKSSGKAGTTLGTSAMTFASLPYRPATVMAWPAFKAVSTWVNRLVTETCMISRNGPG